MCFFVFLPKKKRNLSLIACFFVMIRFLKPAGCKKKEQKWIK